MLKCGGFGLILLPEDQAASCGNKENTNKHALATQHHESGNLGITLELLTGY